MKRGKTFEVVIAVLVVIGLTASLLQAQAGRGKGRLQGKVIFAETKQPAIKADVMIQFSQDLNLKFETKTDDDGEWGFIGLGTGEWRITASFPGYMPDKKALKVSQFTSNPYLVMTLEKITASSVVADTTSLLGQGNKFFEEGKYDEALTAFKGYLEKAPEFIEVYINIGNCLMKMEKYDEAIDAYNKFLDAARIKNEKIELQAQALAAIGEIFVKQEKMEKAQEFFMKSVELNPKDEILAYNVAEIFFGNNKNEEAAKYYLVASQIKPQWGTPYLKLGYVYLNLGDIPKATEYFNKFIQVDPENPEVPNIKEVINGLKEN
ncbi:MAG TPA: tetratricopeptide repeat protein [Candidatus Deferrimicrobium sp.]|nr:tetratricopeptide repeat protein [Candidatus Deferrimicrobium sp.]